MGHKAYRTLPTLSSSIYHFIILRQIYHPHRHVNTIHIHRGEIISEVMRDHLLYLGVPPQNINIQTHLPKVDWEQHHRIELLADMRNEAMKPLYDTSPSGKTHDGKDWSAVIFYNDVYLSGTHFLELLHQHYMQDSDMTCGWDHAGRWFYDGWVGRDMSGDLYTPFPVKEEDKDLPQKVGLLLSSRSFFLSSSIFPPSSFLLFTSLVSLTSLLRHWPSSHI
jgi:hypothetical protein